MSEADVLWVLGTTHVSFKPVLRLTLFDISHAPVVPEAAALLQLIAVEAVVSKLIAVAILRLLVGGIAPG